MDPPLAASNSRSITSTYMDRYATVGHKPVQRIIVPVGAVPDGTAALMPWWVIKNRWIQRVHDEGDQPDVDEEGCVSQQG